MRCRHRGGLVPHSRLDESNDLAALPEGEAVAVPAKAGDVVAFSSLLLHASGTNLSNRPRRVYLAQYTAEPMLEPDGLPRRNAVPLLAGGRQVTFA